jgi:hypothetical protein
MRFHADLLDIQLIPDLLIALSRYDQGEDLPLARRQTIGPSISEGAGHRLRKKRLAIFDPAEGPKNRFVGNPFY